MIHNRIELYEYIRADEARYVKRHPRFLGWFLGDENFVVMHYLRVLRHLEFYTNKKKLPWDYILYTYYFVKFRRLKIRTGIHLNVNTVGKGLYIPHFAGGIYANCNSIGEDCIITTGCVLGNKGGG